ncbi:hypothetical protein [Thalassobellus suaedae]|uniref:Uncharacterized protein n=1 Tax=Thalassobellus suaedae TaxID=3074124 RepID=A0ABY9XPR7_9FLAO|nr:hypothetical protein RHP51_11650 [Flavobacteriaceae bacterium HL-DH14]WNH13166.1 hypothetical protein RHP49_02675 [Flavobacteriaceae bacterium HL-DH10]
MTILNDKQSLFLCGVMAGGIFVSGILEILTNFVVLTILTLVFFTIIINLFLTKENSKEEEKDIK